MACSSEGQEEQLFSQGEYRTDIKFRCLLGISAAQIHRELTSIPGSYPPAERTVADWAARFREGRHSVEDDPRPGRPVSAVTPEFISLVEEAVLEDPHCSVSELAQQCGISVGSTHQILVEIYFNKQSLTFRQY
jgi:hypothetical protein